MQSMPIEQTLRQIGTTKPQALDIGCGRTKMPGAVGIDRVPLEGVDIVHDLEELPWPFGDNSFAILYANHCLEHLRDIVATLREIHRVAAPNAMLHVRVPHYASYNFHSDLTHRVAFGYRSFDHFSTNGNIAYDFYEPFKFEIVRRRIKFLSALRRFDPFRLLGIEALANAFPRVYERFFVYWLPPGEIVFQLRVRK